MATIHQFDCADCGEPTTATRKNARYCPVCRLFRNLIYLGSNRQTCASCETKFAPLTVNERLCSDCDLTTAKRQGGSCAICEQRGVPLVAEGVAICIYCARAPEKRDVVTRALGKRRRTQTEKNGGSS